MAVRLKHPVHGFLIAYGQAQVAELRECGWQIDESYDKPVKPQPVKSESSSKPAKQKHSEFHFADLLGHKDKE